MPLTLDFWIQLDIRIQAIAVAREEDVATATAKALLDFLSFYDPLQGLRAALLGAEIGLKELLGENKRQREDNKALKEDNERLRREKKDLKGDIGQLGNVKTLLLDEFKERDQVGKLRDKEKNLEREQLPNKDQGGQVELAPELKIVETVVKESGVQHFVSGHTTLHSGHMASGFAPGAPPPS